jgi:hypothetical protein
MKVIILNWKNGENDPFTVFNAALKKQFEAHGRNVEIIEITSENWISEVINQIPEGIEFIITWQGLHSNIRMNDQGDSLWDLLKIPLISLHGDHPAHMPINHQLESAYCFHLYFDAEHARYSNRHFRRAYAARTTHIPKLSTEHPLEEQSGEFFVFAKNITDPSDTEKRWQANFEKPLFDTYMQVAETFKSRITQTSEYTEIHDLIDEVIEKNNLEWLYPSTNISAFHQIHSQLDFYARNYRSVVALKSLREFPVHIYGRGWENHAKAAASQHKFHPGLDMAESQKLYYSRYGIIDISPTKGFHDRTMRAMSNKQGFISSANLEDAFNNIEDYQSLFFDFRDNTLAERCALVMHAPEQHRHNAKLFANQYYEKFHFQAFINKIESLSQSIPRQNIK